MSVARACDEMSPRNEDTSTMSKVLHYKSVGVLAIIGLLAASPALAHTGHNSAFAMQDGLLHPLGGADHLLAMVAVGIWAAQLGGRALLALPATFVLAMIAGAGGAQFGFVTGGIELAIVASVIAFGAAVALRLSVPLAVSVLPVAVFAAAHGQAHGLEVPDGASILAYVAGFSIATALLHAAGVAGALLLAKVPLLVRGIGAAISAAGIALAVS
ncbi:MAG: HupE/UreJ family protein [Hyphomicrobiaceae bacterium]